MIQQSSMLKLKIHNHLSISQITLVENIVNIIGITTGGGVVLPRNPTFVRVRILLRSIVAELLVDCKALGSGRGKLETDKSDVVGFL